MHLKNHLKFGLVLGPILVRFGSPNASLWGTFSEPKSIKKCLKIDRKSDCSKCRPKIAPRPPKTIPRCPPDPPGAPKMPSRTPPDGPKGFSEAPGPAAFFGKIKKFEIVEKKSKKKSATVIHGGHSHRSLTKTESTFTTVGTQRVAAVVARSALQSAAPCAAQGSVL